MFVISESQHQLLLKLAQNTSQRQSNKIGRSLRPSVFLNDFESLAENSSLPLLKQDKCSGSPQKAQENIPITTEQVKLPRISRFSRFKKQNDNDEPQFLSHQPSPQKEELPPLNSISPEFKNRSSLVPHTERRRTTKKNVHFEPIAEIINIQGVIEKPVHRFKRTFLKLQTEVS